MVLYSCPRSYVPYTGTGEGAERVSDSFKKSGGIDEAVAFILQVGSKANK